MNLASPITDIKGIGEKSAKIFNKLNIATVGDLLTHFPKDYKTFEEPRTLAQILGETPQNGSFLGTVSAAPALKYVRKLAILTLVVRDMQQNSVRVTFFNMPYLKNSLQPGQQYVFYGTVYEKGSLICMDHPKLYKPAEYRKLMGSLQPVYSLTKGISNDTLSKYIRLALKELEPVKEFLPEEIIQERGFDHYADTLSKIHMPQSLPEMIAARKRLSYEEFFFFIMAMKYKRFLEADEETAIPFIQVADTKRLIESLPYQLTGSQKKAWEEIEQDMMCENPANRLIQGDVGSGKTIIAILSLLMCAANGYQGALMAPTEVLAVQHFELIREMTKKYKLPFQPVLLVGSLTAKAKREAYAKIADGDCNVIVGTHALIQEGLTYQKLALVITDEQHRFGVKQRDTLSGKGEKRPHTLVMSATPIPRSLAIILYGDLAVSTIPELPGNRLPIKNCVIQKNDRDKAYRFIEKEVASGHQVYVICPMVESGVMDELENVTDYSELLRQKLFPQIRVDYLHGKMRPAQKNEIMTAFAEHRIDVLVSTTVIEVGINVPNATVMLVENADRFGLAALHQIRGRVGRGSAQSYCIFIDTKESRTSRQRLDILNHSNDGFFIANEDLKQRGPGDLTGTLQSGDFCFKYADIYADSDMLMAASEDIGKIVKTDPLLNEETHIICKRRCQKYFEEQYIDVL